MKFKIDENLPVEVADLLRRSDHDAATVLEEELGGSADFDIALICRQESRALITLDADFADIRTYPRASITDWLFCVCGDRASSVPCAHCSV